MKKNQMPKALGVLLLALGLLLLVQFFHDQIPFIATRTRNTRFFTPEESPSPTPAAVETPPKGAEHATPLPPGKIHTSIEQVRAKFLDLSQRRLRKLRIAFFADSSTEGEVITGKLRQMLQARYGGEGVGWHGIAPRDSLYVNVFYHETTPAWKRISLFSLKADPLLKIPPSGEYYLAPAEGEGEAKVLYSTVKGAPLISPKARLFYGPPKEGAREPEKVKLKKGKEWLDFELSGTQELNKLPLPALKTYRLEFKASPLRPIFGVSFDSPSGAQVDNFSMRGNGGDGIAKLDGALMEDFHKEFNWGLAAMLFGLNAVQQGETDFRWYRAMMRKSIQHLKTHLPGCGIVVISVLDMGVRAKDGSIKSDKSLPYVLAAQKAAAADEGVAFIDAYHLMGGEGTLKHWVESTPPLANKDYMHLNHRGGGVLAGILYKELTGEEPLTPTAQVLTPTAQAQLSPTAALPSPTLAPSPRPTPTAAKTPKPKLKPKAAVKKTKPKKKPTPKPVKSPAPKPEAGVEAKALSPRAGALP